MTFRVEKHKWWNSTRTRLVDTGDPEAAFLAYPRGTDVPDDEARRVGLTADSARLAAPVPAPAEKIRKAAPSNKMVTGPSPNKATTPPEETL
jgi:hypothetical protein